MTEKSSAEKISGLHILLLEDNYLLAHELAGILSRHDCELVGPVSTVSEGLLLADDPSLDGAILDINLIDGNCEPVAERLLLNKCPFFFITGFTSPILKNPRLADIPRLQKPLDQHLLIETMAAHFTVNRNER